MSTETNKHGVKKPVQPKAGRVVAVAKHKSASSLSATVAKKKAKHSVALAKLARG